MIQSYPQYENICLNEFIDNVEEHLMKEPMEEFLYPQALAQSQSEEWEEYVPELKRLNEHWLQKLNHQANIYVLFEYSNDQNRWDPVYIGQRKSNGMRTRITQHLIKKHYKTGAQDKKVKEIIRNGGRVGLSFIKVNPETLRLVAEESLLIRNPKIFSWNKHR